MKQLDFTTPFAADIKTTIFVRNKYGQKEEIPFIVPCIKKKEKRVCPLCKNVFEFVLHILPSGKEHGEGCLKCHPGILESYKLEEVKKIYNNNLRSQEMANKYNTEEKSTVKRFRG
jgi:hypothetical protein